MSVADQAFQALARQGGTEIEAAIIIEASVPLELSGEAVRNRICTFTDEDGQEWALRPDLTLPVAQAEVAARRIQAPGETLRHYRGPVFRLPALAGEPVEYDQIGLERFGGARSIEEDVWLFETLVEACQASGISGGYACFGDLSIFPAFVEALNLADDVMAGLKRAFRQEGGVRAYLTGRDQGPSGISSRMIGMGREEISAFVEDIFAMTGIPAIGERSSDEIVERLFERSRSDAGVGLAEDVRALLDQVLSLEVAAADAPQALYQLAESAGLKDLAATLDSFAQRTEHLFDSGQAAFMIDARFATRFGRRFTYYDGFVFEISAADSAMARQRPFAAGGRYDSLLADLSGGAVDATAIGGVVIPHRLAQASGGQP
ncbi:MAG: ATP phosphoribosyltransferase regulatory subunit [Pseudomonadota bacterium]